MALQYRKFFFVTILFLCPYAGIQTQADEVAETTKFTAIYQRVKPRLEQLAAQHGARLGDPVFMRLFKEEKEIEVWIRPQDAQGYVLLETWPICHFSRSFNNLPDRTAKKLFRLDKWGPKLREGDWRAPEGFYTVMPAQMNPYSQRHLSFNLGFPNAYDRVHGHTGTFLMVHGGCSSVGCYAITDKGVEEVYSLAYAALKGGQKAFSVHIFPFRMTPENMKKYSHTRWTPFWENLQQGYQMFEKTYIPPKTGVKDGRYVFYEG